MAPARQNANPSVNNNNNYNENGEHFMPHSNGGANASSSRITIATTTGAVPKTTTTAKRLATLIKQQMQQQHQQQQQQQQQHHQRKNTEIVQPLQRELKTLNDFLLASVNRTRINSSNLNNYQTQQSQQQQQQQTHEIISNLDASAVNYDTVDNLQENQRSCFPVRPIQRVRHQQQATRAARFQNQQQQQRTQQQANDSSASTTYATNATIGVVIPTTPNTTVNSATGSCSNSLQIQQLATNNVVVQAPSATSAANEVIGGIPAIINDILTTPVIDINSLRQQFELVRGILGLDENWNSSSGNKQAINAAQVTAQQPDSANMVHEINPNTNGHDGVVNSASLEDVALSEMSDNRAQSIQSLHSIPDTPTPDATPSFDELQDRLAASSRNMQTIQDKQEQLLRLQSAAKAHLSEMEKLRQQTNKLSFAPNSNGVAGQANGETGDSPNYESIEQVQNDMTSLVGRMKNLTAFIHNQNELSDILGDDGPEILAEQEALQQKLESLRSQRDDMRHLVDELQSINHNAEHQVAATAKTTKPRSEVSLAAGNHVKAEGDNSRQLPEKLNELEVVPPTSVRNVPIEIQQKASSAAQRAAAAQSLIDQKNADIEALKSQMERLKDMLTTVNMIEDQASDKQKARCTPTTTLTSALNMEHDRTPFSDHSNEDNISRKVRALSEVTADLRAESANLQQERDRITTLKAEIIRRKEQAAAAAQMGEDAIKRSSLTPTPTPTSRQQQYYESEREIDAQSERDQLKSEYEMKKKEFDFLCKRLEGANLNNGASVVNTVSEADDEADDTNDSDFSINKYCGNQQASNSTLRRELSSSTVVENASRETTQNRVQRPHENQQQSQLQRQKLQNDDESNAAMANSTVDGASLDAASFQSGSTRSYIMPPPMPAVSAAWAAPILPPLPATWNSNYFYASAQPPPGPPPVSQHHMPTANEYVSTFGGCAGTTTSSTNSNVPIVPLNTTDPMILQQILQTQQMLINSICQSNQTLWHQQREIDGINGLLHALQDRVSNLSVAPADIGFALRSESVPPPSALSGSSLLNNQHYLSASRAQSEQPLPFGSGGSAFTNYQQHQQVLQQRQQHQQRSNLGVYNYEAAQQQQHNSSSVYHTTLNNAAVTTHGNATAAPSVHPTHFNNETPMSPHMPNSPGPIFMHHHNNTIHQNNANLRTQNQHAANNNLHQQQQQASSNQPTLNNQVPPGNRANNYWDNFRSYSRQNLLSLNSTKSNEDQQQILLATQQTNRLHDGRQHFTPASRHPTYAAAAVHHHVQRQQQTHLYDIPSARHNLNSETMDTNNLNCNNSNNNAKYLNILTPHRPYQPNVAVDFYENLQRQADEIIGNTALYRNCDIDSTNMATNLNNMNLNYGNSPLFQRNKVPAKSATSATLIQSQQQLQPTAESSQSRRSYETDSCLFDQHCENANTELSGAHTHFPKRTQLQRRSMLRLSHNFQPFELQANTNYSPAPEEQFAPRPINLARTGEGTVAEGRAGQLTSDVSEEINRNLLVNALKSDKFTTKFYESIKEDVFRRLERFFKQQEHIENNGLQPPAVSNEFFNDVSSQRRDPFRKLNLNQQQQQQQQQQQTQQHIISSSVQTDAELDDQMLLEDDVQNAETESNKADDDEQMAISILQKHFDTNDDDEKDNNDDDNGDRAAAQNEKPEDEVSAHDEPIIKDRQSCAGAKQQHGFQWGNNTISVKSEAVKKSEQEKSKQRHRLSTDATAASITDDCAEAGPGACSLPATKKKPIENEKFFVTVVGCQSPPPEIEITPDYELIEYIINRIRNQTHTNTVMNDSMLVEISKLTATAAQNSATAKLAANTLTMPILSAKRIYAKIKKMCISRNRDEFLSWYQQYLEGVFLVEQDPGISCDIGEQDQHIHTKIDYIAYDASGANSNKSVKNRFVAMGGTRQRLKQHKQDSHGDLAEADQNSANNCVNETMEKSMEVEKIPLEKEEGIYEFENNENPEEEGNANTGACALASPQDKGAASN